MKTFWQQRPKSRNLTPDQLVYSLESLGLVGCAWLLSVTTDNDWLHDPQQSQCPSWWYDSVFRHVQVTKYLWSSIHAITLMFSLRMTSVVSSSRHCACMGTQHSLVICRKLPFRWLQCFHSQAQSLTEIYPNLCCTELSKSACKYTMHWNLPFYRTKVLRNCGKGWKLFVSLRGHPQHVHVLQWTFTINEIHTEHIRVSVCPKWLLVIEITQIYYVQMIQNLEIAQF